MKEKKRKGKKEKKTKMKEKEREKGKEDDERRWMASTAGRWSLVLTDISQSLKVPNVRYAQKRRCWNFVAVSLYLTATQLVDRAPSSLLVLAVTLPGRLAICHPGFPGSGDWDSVQGSRLSSV